MSDTNNPQSNDAERLGLAPQLLEILVCPLDRAALRIEGDRLACSRCGRTFAVRDGIPSMVLDEATA
jgi:uncharacterized protein YbaR (Trm112 family)